MKKKKTRLTPNCLRISRLVALQRPSISHNFIWKDQAHVASLQETVYQSFPSINWDPHKQKPLENSEHFSSERERPMEMLIWFHE